MSNHFSNEVDGQLKFYQDYLPLVDKTLKTDDILLHIEKVYFGGASVKTSGFSSDAPLEVLEYGQSQLDESRLITLLRSKQYTKINIDENCIVGWAERFYRENKGAKKSDFIGDHTGKVKRCLQESQN